MSQNLHKGFKKVAETEFVNIWAYKKKNLSLVDFKPYKDIDFEEAKQIEKIIFEVLDRTAPCYGITKLNEGNNMTSDARAYFAQCELTKNHTAALAVVFNTLAHRMLYNFYIKFNKPNINHKGFSNVDAAVNWLIKQGA